MTEGLCASVHNFTPVRSIYRRPPAGTSTRGTPTAVGATALATVMALQFGLTSVGIPLWVADHTEAPTTSVSLEERSGALACSSSSPA